jgi:hypothetical protein
MFERFTYCTGCLPTDAELGEMPILALWGEMLNRCVAQTPDTKSRDGALAALIEDGPEYRTLARRLRNRKLGRPDD